MNREGRPSPLDTEIQSLLEAYFEHTIPIIGLPHVSETTLFARSIVISTVEAEEPLLAVLSEQDMSLVKFMTDNASKIVWVTNADVMSGTRPDFAPVLGLSRALMLEQPSVQFAVFDVDDALPDLGATAKNIFDTMQQLMEDPYPDFEFAQKRGMVHSLRWEPEEPLNSLFRLKQNGETINETLEAAGRCELSIKQPGQMDTIYFVEKDYKEALRADHVEIRVKSVGINAKVSHIRHGTFKAEAAD